MTRPVVLPGVFQLPLERVNLLGPLAATGVVLVVGDVGHGAHQLLSLQHGGDVGGGLVELLSVVLQDLGVSLQRVVDGGRPRVSRPGSVAGHLVIDGGEAVQQGLQVSLQALHVRLRTSQQRLLVRLGLGVPGVVGAELAEAHQLHVNVVLEGPSLLP